MSGVFVVAKVVTVLVSIFSLIVGIVGIAWISLDWVGVQGCDLVQL